jgi:NTE family protein
MDVPRPAPELALVLGGGGARAAYQVGVLRGIARRYPNLRAPILTGVSAGAINAAFLANHEGKFVDAVNALTELWSSLRMEDVVQARATKLLGTTVRWGLNLVSGGSSHAPPVQGMVDTTPLRQLLTRTFAPRTAEAQFSGLSHNIARGNVHSLAVTTTNYATGESVTWVQGGDVMMSTRPMQLTLPCILTPDHIAASASLPLFFPAVQLAGDWHGDGGLRQTAPLSPALHLGAHKILAIATRREQPTGGSRAFASGQPYPAPARIIGLMLNSIFLDMFDTDATTMERINQLVRKLPPEERAPHREVKLKVIRPSADLGLVAREFEFQLPGALKYLTRGWGTQQSSSADSLAVVLFESGYTRRLIQIGEQDAEAWGDEIAEFLES